MPEEFLCWPTTFTGLILAVLLFAQMVDPQPTTGNGFEPGHMPANLTIFIVRHAEKPTVGGDLAPEGVSRAQEYVQYFQKQVKYDGKPIQWNFLFASAESVNSDRPFLTLQPLSEAIHVDIDSDFKDKHFDDVAKELRRNKGNKFDNANVLICWHHGEILQLAWALGANSTILPASAHWPAKWPGEAYGWLLKLYFTPEGILDRDHTEAINEELMPDDTIPVGRSD